MNKQTVAMNTVRAIVEAEPTFSQGFVFSSRVIQAGHVAGLAQVTTREWLKLLAPQMGVEILAMRDDPRFNRSRIEYRTDIIGPRTVVVKNIVRTMVKKNPKVTNSVIARAAVVALEGACFAPGTAGFQTVLNLVSATRKTLKV